MNKLLLTLVSMLFFALSACASVSARDRAPAVCANCENTYKIVAVLTWRDVAYTDDSYLDAVQYLDEDVQKADNSKNDKTKPVSKDISDIPASRKTPASGRTSEYRLRMYRPPDAMDRWKYRKFTDKEDNLEILKKEPLEDRNLTRKYKRLIPPHSNKTGYGTRLQDRQPLEPRNLIDKYNKIGDRNSDNDNDPQLYDRQPLESRNLIDKYNKIGDHNPDNDNDSQLYKRQPLEPRDLLQKYNRIGTPNPESWKDFKLIDRQPLEPRNLIEKYNSIGDANPDNVNDYRLYDRKALENRDLIKKYNNIGDYNPANKNDSERLKQNPLDERDLLQKYEEWGK